MDVKDLCLMGLYDSADVDMLQETKKKSHFPSINVFFWFHVLEL